MDKLIERFPDIINAAVQSNLGILASGSVSFFIFSIHNAKNQRGVLTHPLDLFVRRSTSLLLPQMGNYIHRTA